MTLQESQASMQRKISPIKHFNRMQHLSVRVPKSRNADTSEKKFEVCDIKVGNPQETETLTFARPR